MFRKTIFLSPDSGVVVDQIGIMGGHHRGEYCIAKEKGIKSDKWYYHRHKPAQNWWLGKHSGKGIRRDVILSDLFQPFSCQNPLKFRKYSNP